MGCRRMVLLLGLMLSAGCSAPKSQTTPHLTERQRDSILAREPLPGATVVGHALDVTDREAARAAGMNSQVDSLP